MRRRNLSKIQIIFAILLFSLASISISYAGLTDNINIFGTVTTSEDFDTTCGQSSNTAWARMYNYSEDFTYEFPGPNWATYIICEPSELPQTFYLFAGQHYWVGELYVWKDSNYLYVKYNLDEDNYSMSESQLHVATLLDGIPHTKNGNPIPGQFDYSKQYDPTEPHDLYQIDWDSDWDNVDLYIAAHAVVWGIYP